MSSNELPPKPPDAPYDDEGWVAVVKPGRVMFELEGVPVELAKKSLGLAASKLPLRTRFVTREET